MLDTNGATNESQDDVANDADSFEQADELVTEDVESSVEEGTPGEEETESLVYDIDGEETTLDQIREWKNGNLRQADYTRKTQATAQETKAAKAAQEKAKASLAKIDAVISELDDVINADLKGIDWNELRDSDISEYTRLKELQEARGKARQKALAKKQEISEELIHDSKQKLIAAMGYDDPVKGMERHKKDVSLLNATGVDISQINDHEVMQLIIEGARYREIMSKKPSVSKKVVKAPKVTKPGGEAVRQEKPKTLAQRLYGT